MINRHNYFDNAEKNNLIDRFPDFKEFHDFVHEATDGGRDWTAYEDEPDTKKLIDAYFSKVSSRLQQHNSASNPPAVEKNQEQPRQQHKKSPSGKKGKPGRPKSDHPSGEKKQPAKKRGRKPMKGKKAPKQKKVLNLPKGKLVELVDPHLLFVGRYLRMKNQKRSRNALEHFFSQINQAADARLLRKASPYAGHIIYIQKQLLKMLQGGQEEVSVEIPAVKFDELLRAVAKEQQMASVRLLKRYHNMAGRPTTIEKATKLYNEMYNAIEKGKIPENDRLFKRVAKVMRDLSDYVKAEDSSAALVRLPAELGGVLGFMDGCLCVNDRMMKAAEAPHEVNCSFRGR